jgi:plasmid maintenance system antidote protein VapI
MSDVAVSRMLATPTVIYLDTILEEQPFSFTSIDELVKALGQASKAANRCNLYACYLIGKAADKDMLMSKYGITVTDLADKLGISRASIYNYRTIAELFTRKQIEKLANMSVPLKALLVLGEARNALGDDAVNKMIAAIMCGDIKSLKSVKQEFQNLLQESLAPYNMIPGAQPPEKLELPEDTEDTIEVTPEEAILEAEEVEEDYDDDKYEENETSLNEKDAKNALKLINSTTGSLIKNYLDITNNAEAQIMKALDTSNVVINTTSEADYDRAITELCEANQATLETCLKMHEVFKRYGYVRRKTEIPENIAIEELLGYKGGEKGC